MKKTRLPGLLPVLSIGAALLAAPSASAQSLPPNPLPEREQARMHILDVCVETEAPKVGPDVDVTAKCQCYAKGMAEVLSGADVATVISTDRFPPALRGEASSIYAQCAASGSAQGGAQ